MSEPISLDQQIACIRREIGMRENVYPRWVSSGRMAQKKADHELTAMKAALATLEAQRLRETPAGLL